MAVSYTHLHTLPVLEKAFSDPFCLYERLAEYYEEKGYFINNPARGYRYQVLLDFAVSAEPEKEELYRQLLTLDMYLRENMKSRPAFALTLLENPVSYTHLSDYWLKVIFLLFSNGTELSLSLIHI